MKDLAHFDSLKLFILEKFRESHPEWDEPLYKFRTREIQQLQQLIQEDTGNRISERWIYTHLKIEKAEKLPRIDMLDLLSAWVGAGNWQQFKAQNHIELSPNQTQQKPKYLWLAGIFILLAVLMSLAFLALPNFKYTICLELEAASETMDWKEVKCILLHEDESPETLNFNESGCLEIRTTKKRITFVLDAPYHRADTIVRQLRKRKSEESFKLQTDDYAIMIHYFSEGAVEDWKKRRQQLDKIIAPTAEIIQLTPDGKLGMEMYDKKDFINKLTLPLSSLRHLRIIETEYNDAGQIQKLRFIQESN